MIGLVSTLATAICQNCGGPILLLKSDIERTPHWAHDAVEGRYLRECPGTLYAYPSPNYPAQPVGVPEDERRSE